MKKLLYCLLWLFVLLATACSNLHPLHVELHGSRYLNPDAQYHSLPVMVKVYQLKTRDAFDAATFSQLWRQSKSVLGDSLVTSVSARLQPGESKTVRMSKTNETKYVGVMAVYRQPSSQHWRIIRKIGRGIPYIPQNITVSLTGNHVYLK